MTIKDKTAAVIAIMIISVICYYFIFPDRNWLGKPYLDNSENEGFAVVELFTSEGCSSCPPADDLMAKMQEESKGKNIYLLAYHVDYWDSADWKDRFSDSRFTARQQQYSDWMNRTLIYTPQFIVNGVSEFGGDDGRTLYRLVANALMKKPSNTLTVNVHENGDSLLAGYETSDIIDSSLLIAIVQKKASSNVKGGENDGDSLEHVQIVKRVEIIKLNAISGNFKLKEPQGFNNDQWEVVAFVQNNVTGVITAATRARFNK